MVNKVGIIKKIRKAKLVGRGGASFPVAVKWQTVKKSLLVKDFGYIVINGAEGEPGVAKDGFIVKHYPQEVINGIFLADSFLGSEKIKQIYFFLNQKYYKQYSTGLKNVLREKKYQAISRKLVFIIKPNNLTYISGEETALFNLIEGKKVEPRLKPPYPAESGLFGKPTLINNTETFFNVSLAAQDKYHQKRFYTVGGDVLNPGVFHLSDEITIFELLKKTKNLPKEKFFVQVGGRASGEVLHFNQLEREVSGMGAVIVYDALKTDYLKLLRYWLNFFQEQSCGQCTVCREGTYRLQEMTMVDANKFEESLFWDLVDLLAETSYCSLGKMLPIPIRSYFNNIIKK